MTKNKEKIAVEVTKKDFKELLLATMLYSWVRGGLADQKGEDFKQYERLEEILLRVADEHGFVDIAEKFKGTLVPADTLSHTIEDLVEESDDDTFWHELVVRLGKRDFYQTLTSEEKHALAKEDWLPERVQEIYEKYEQEFEEYGLGRLTLDENKK